MAKRLTEDDIRRIFREEAERGERMRKWEETNKTYDPEVEKVWKKLTPMTLPLKPDGDFDLRAIAAQIIDTYWEVVEDECNG